MDQSPEIGIRVYNSPPPQIATSSAADLSTAPGSQKSRAVANGVQKSISKTAILANFLPTGTLLTLETVLPTIYSTGKCSHVANLMIKLLLLLCALSCFFFHFTDSFHTPDGKIYYGFVTTKGLLVFKPDLEIEVPKDDKYRVAFSDLVHALMSVLVFVAIAFSDCRVKNCLFVGHAKEMDEVMMSFLLIVGIIRSGLFLVFPNTRSGVGCGAT